MINIYRPDEIEKIEEGGKILGETLQKVLEKTSPGITTRELDKYAEELIEAAGAKPSFKMEKGYFWTTCMNVNDMVVHGIPGEYRLQAGDVLGVDVGSYCKGFHTDTSWTVIIGEKRAERREQRAVSDFLQTGKIALEKAIKVCRVGNHIGDISQTIQETVEGSGYSCVRQLVGHGVGRALHEDPEIPCYLRGRRENTPEIKKGMVLAIEVIYNQGKAQVVYAGDDGWTIVSRDRSLSGLFEHTVVVTEKGAEVVTKVN